MILRGPDVLEREFILRGQLEGFGPRRYARDRVVATRMIFAGREYADITYPACFEACLVPGEVAALVMTAVRDVSTVVAVLDRTGTVRIHPELSRLAGGARPLVGWAFGARFAERLDGLLQAVAHVASAPAGGGA